MKMQKILLSTLFLLFGFISYAQSLIVTGQISPVTVPVSINILYEDAGTFTAVSAITDTSGFFLDTFAVSSMQGLVEVTFNDCSGTLVGDSGFYFPTGGNPFFDFGTLDYCPNSGNQTFVTGVFANTSTPVNYSLSLDGGITFSNFSTNSNGVFNESFLGLSGQTEVFLQFTDCNGVLQTDSASNISSSATQEIFNFSNLDYCFSANYTLVTGQINPIPTTINPLEIDLFYSNSFTTITTTVVLDSMGFFTDSANIIGGNYIVTASFEDCNGSVVSFTANYIAPTASSAGYYDFGVLNYCQGGSNTTYFGVEGEFVSTNTPVNYTLTFYDNGPIVYTEMSDSTGYISIDSISIPNIPDSITISYTDCNGLAITTVTYAPLVLPFPLVFDFGVLNYCNTPTPNNCSAGFTLNQNVVIDSFGNVISTGNVLVTNTSLGSNLTYTWDFGDGSATYTGTNFLHTYTGNGPYLVCLTIADSANCLDTFCDSVMVNANGVLSGKTNAGFTIQMGDGSDDTNGPNGIDKLEVGSNFSIYPNPANTFININYEGFLNESSELAIYNMTGKLIFKKAYANNTSLTNKIDISNLNQGVYIVQFKTSHGLITKTLSVK